MHRIIEIAQGHSSTSRGPGDRQRRSEMRSRVRRRVPIAKVVIDLKLWRQVEAVGRKPLAADLDLLAPLTVDAQQPETLVRARLRHISDEIENAGADRAAEADIGQHIASRQMDE